MEIKSISSKVDRLEQESLANVLSLQGSAVDDLLASVADEDTATATPLTSSRQPAHLRRAVCALLSTTVDHLTTNDIPQVSVHGRERKHVKLTCVSRDIKLKIITSIRHTKPGNLFANDYLTKQRALTLYKLRCLKKRFETITSTYSRNGVIYYKTIGSTKEHLVIDDSDVKKLEVKLLNSVTSTNTTNNTNINTE